MAPISGTGYAAAYVSGVAALVRSRFPDLTAQQVVGRISGTAHTGARSPSNLVGAGSIDPVAALTWVVPEGPESMVDPAAVRQIPLRCRPPGRSDARVVAFAGAGVLAALVLAVIVASAKRKDNNT